MPMLRQMAASNGFTCKVHHLDAKVGGTYKCHLQIFQPVKVIPLANILNWFQKSIFAIPINLMIQYARRNELQQLLSSSFFAVQMLTLFRMVPDAIPRNYAISVGRNHLIS
jgi:hypothetical protein